MYDVAKNLCEVLGSLPDGVRLVAISKFHPVEYIEAAYRVGQRVFGESQEQELARKVESLPGTAASSMSCWSCILQKRRASMASPLPPAVNCWKTVNGRNFVMYTSRD